MGPTRPAETRADFVRRRNGRFWSARTVAWYQRALAGSDYRCDQPFADLDEACDFYEVYLGVSGPEARGFLRDFLAARLVREPGGWVAPYAKRAVVLRWPGTARGG